MGLWYQLVKMIHHQSCYHQSCLVAAGFDDDEAALPEEARGFSGHRLLTEFFTLPQKYLFVDLRRIPEKVIKKAGSKLYVSILLADFDQNIERSVSRSTIRLGCTPIVNLFRKPLTL